MVVLKYLNMQKTKDKEQRCSRCGKPLRGETKQEYCPECKQFLEKLTGHEMSA